MDVSGSIDPGTSREHGVRPFGPVLGLVGGILLLAGSFAPWAVVGLGTIADSGVRGAVGWGMIVPVVGLTMIVLSVVSLISGHKMSLPQIVIGLGAIGAIAVSYVGPVTAEVANQALSTQPVRFGYGILLAVLGAVIASLGALATQLRVPLADAARGTDL